jgi:hypothetical protein
VAAIDANGMRQDAGRHHTVQTAIERSPVAFARLAGVLYLCIIVIGVAGEAVVRDSLIVSGNATATATNIAAGESLWRASVAGEVGYLALAVVLNLILYTFFHRVNRPVAQLAAMFNLVSISVEVVGRLMLLAPLVLVGPGSALAALEPAQRHALAYFFVRMHEYGFGLSLIFFAGVCLAWGWLIRKSGFLPGFIGWLMQLAGACYLVNSFAVLLSPALASKLFPAILLPSFVAELALCLWLLGRGIDASKWLRHADDVALASGGAR